MTKIEEASRAVREEIVRQYRDDERRKHQLGTYFYENEISPKYIARAAITAIREPTKEMLMAAVATSGDPDDMNDFKQAYQAMIDELLKGK